MMRAVRHRIGRHPEEGDVRRLPFRMRDALSDAVAVLLVFALPILVLLIAEGLS